jgi:hypothetical protein
MLAATSTVMRGPRFLRDLQVPVVGGRNEPYGCFMSAVTDDHANPDDEGGDRYRAVMPTDWTGPQEDRFRRYLAEKLSRIETATNLSLYGRGLSQHYAAGNYPQSATDLNQYTGGNVATDVLGRSSWGAPELSLECAADAIQHGPELILVTSSISAFPRAANFWIHSASALYAGDHSVPLAMRRS